MAGDESTRDEPGDPVDQPDAHEPADLAAAPVDEPVDESSDETGDETGDDPGEPAGEPVTGASSRRRRRRVSKWDRPPEPHDWRWAVGGVGRVLVSVGILMFAFVGYQLWGTGIQEARAQNRLEDQFQELLAAATTLPPATTATSTTAPPTTEPDPDSTGDVASTSSSSTTSTTTTLAPPPVIERPPVGGPVGLLELPSIGVQKAIVEGVTVDALRDAPGHFPETPFPGQLGNAAIAGHRTTYGHPFLDLDDVEIGDDVIVTTLAGRYTYVVSATLVVDPGDYAAVIPTTDPTVATLTLLTCNPPYSTRERLVVVATLDPARSSVVTLPTPTEGVPVSGALPAEDTPVSAEPSESEPAPTDPASTGSASAGPDTSGPATSDTVPADSTPDTAATAGSATTDPVTTTTVPEDSASAFGGGWFDDPDAWPQVALWGLVLTVIALAAHRLSRRVRHDWVGALVGIAPFVVALYFWFENVNRLLPPGL